MNPHTTCSSASLDAGEALLGTGVSRAVHWVGLEVRGAWRPKALLDNDLDPGVQAWLGSLRARGDTRPVFVKRRGRRDGVTVWYANVETHRVHRFWLEHLDQAPALPWDAIFAGTTEAGATDEQPLFVCTHSTRDHCCGLHGPAVARALDKVAPGRVWQCSHLGGHRFAATLVALPHGVHYGRVRPDDAARLVAELDRGRVHDLDQLRGFTRWPVAVQAAVDRTRRQGGWRRLDEVTAQSWEEVDDRTRVTVRSPGGIETLVVERISGETLAPPSCKKDPAAVKRWDVQPLSRA